MARSQGYAALGLWLALTSGGWSFAGAQEAPFPDLVTDRPDQTESAVVVPDRTFQVELGLGMSQEKARDGDEDTREFPGTLVRWGISSRLELRLAWAGRLEVETESAGGRSKLRGAADPEIGAKLALLSSARGAPLDLALLGHLSLPAGDDEVGSPRADPSLRLNGAHGLGERLGLGWNLGFETASFEDARGETHTLGRYLYTVALGIDLAPRWGMFVELYGDLPASDPAPAAHAFDAGFTWLLAPRVQLDLYGGFGLNDAAPDWIAGAGLSFRVPR